MTIIKKARDSFGTNIQGYITAPTGIGAWTEAQWQVNYVLAFLLSGLLAAIGAFAFSINSDEAWRDGLVFYPVGLKKFIFLSLFTLGHYQIYWFFKNWHWIKKVKGEDIWPIPRAFFQTL